jgi:hypothetical protein
VEEGACLFLLVPFWFLSCVRAPTRTYHPVFDKGRPNTHARASKRNLHPLFHSGYQKEKHSKNTFGPEADRQKEGWPLVALWPPTAFANAGNRGFGGNESAPSHRSHPR